MRTNWERRRTVLGLIRALKDRKKDALGEIKTLDAAIAFYETMRDDIAKEGAAIAQARETKQSPEPSK